MYAQLGGSPPVVDAIMSKVADKRPDLPMMGEHAGSYGFVMNGGTSEHALRLYEIIAENFTGYWVGELSEDEAIANVEEEMRKAFEG